MEMSDDFAYFLGVICGDGYISPKGLIEIKTECKEYLESVYCPLVLRLFGIKANVKYGINTSKTSGSYYRSYFYSRSVSELLIQLGLKSPKTFSVAIPKEIMQSEGNIRISFVRGLFDTDGTIVVRPDKDIINYPTLVIKTRSSSLVDCAHEIFLGMGIKSHKSVWQDRGKPIFASRFYGFKELGKYMNTAGFSHPVKFNKANKTLKDGIIRKGQ